MFLIVVKRLCVCVAVGLVLVNVLSSCGSTRPYVYMQGQFDTAKLSQVRITDPVFQKGDILSIIVYSDNQAATAVYNQQIMGGSASTGVTGASGDAGSASTSGATSGGAGGSPSSGGYLVDENGNIEFQGLGLLHIEGLNRGQLKDLLNSKLKEFLTHPYYTIRFQNNRFTMLGEVQRPGIFNIPSGHINILEALGMAGDMTFYGRRDNVLIIREQNGKREFARLDLTKPEIMSSPYFYLQQNDIVVFEPNRKKISASDQVTVRNISIATGIISVIAVVYSILRR
jgi:polysaccharide export outer membrane protein